VKGKRAKGKERRELLLPLPSAPCSFGGQGRNRTADAGLFRMRLYGCHSDMQISTEHKAVFLGESGQIYSVQNGI